MCYQMMSSLRDGRQKFTESNNKYSSSEYKSSWPKTATQALHQNNVPIFQAQIRAWRRTTNALKTLSKAAWPFIKVSGVDLAGEEKL